MTAREQAEQLRQQAIQTLLEEKDAIDKMLQSLSYSENMPGGKRRGRRSKQPVAQEVSLPVEQNDLPIRQDEA